ncbi:hypothetical protein M1N56_06465 [Dehalococcoidia bacterium]|nr:hypothetical protein [Dehalococcoidia bacterium]
MMLGKAEKKGTARVKRLESVFEDDGTSGKSALLEKPDREKVDSKQLLLRERSWCQLSLSKIVT